PVALTHGIHDVLTADDVAEHAVPVVQVRRGPLRDEKLAAIGARARIRHGEDAGTIMLQRLVELVLELVPRATRPVPRRITTLDHEILDDAMKGQAVIK